MKKYLMFSFLLCLLNINVVMAANYKTDTYGNYYVEEAACAYKDSTEAKNVYKIIFKKASLSKIEVYGVNGNKFTDPSYTLESLTYQDFFQNKDFACPNEIYINTTVDGGNVHFSSSCQKLDDGLCLNASWHAIKLDKNNSYRSEYIEDSSSANSNNKNETLSCSLKKKSLERPSFSDIMYYKKYSDGTSLFVDANGKEITITEGSLNNCKDVINIYVEKVNDSKYKIVNKCNEGINLNCAMYYPEIYDNYYDTDIKEDGSSKNDAEKETNITVQKIAFNPVEPQSCESLLGSPDEDYTPAFYLTKAFNVLKYAAIAILIVMSVIDFTTALSSNDNDALIKASRKTLIRLVFCVIIFLLPYLIKFVLKYLNDRAIDLCGIE